MTDKGTRKLAEELRAWAGRPTDLPAATARARVLARLEHRPKRPTWRLAAAGAALAAGALALALSIGRHEVPITTEPPPVTLAPQQLIVHQLSSGTKLYIVVPPRPAAGEC